MKCVRDIAKASQLPRLETQMLLQYVLQVPRTWLIAHDTDCLHPSQIEHYCSLAQRRLDGEPMAYLVGHREFMGHAFAVSPAVLIPRPETELLVEKAVRYLDERGIGAPRVLDLGTGSGAIAVSIALACPGATVVATDISSSALELAAENARSLSARVEFASGNWYDALGDRRAFDLIVSNPPYIAKGDPHLAQGDLRFEPGNALTDGADGLEAFRAIVQGAPEWLTPRGALWVEHGWDQAAAVCEFLQRTGFTGVRSLRDLAGIQRISGGIYN